jgi:hypothetical protein
LKQERQRQTRFGQVRPAVHTNWQGKKWVGVGDNLLNSANWKTPVDFLSEYLKFIMTPAWGKSELAKPLADRHSVMQWYDAMCRLQSIAGEQAGSDGVFGVAPSGAMRAYLLLAFDLYALQHNSSLQERLLRRLRNPDQYQGARHELFAAATCIRAGFDIEYEDETDRSVGHVEFTASHRGTGRCFCVEAKSRGRSGVFAVKGDQKPVEKPDKRLRNLINDATNKPHKYPLVVFLDLNLPPTAASALTPDWFAKFADPVVRGIDRRGEEDPWDLMVFSNHPEHYSDDDAPATGGYAAGMFGKNTRVGTQPPTELVALCEAAYKFRTLPNRFEEM